MTYYHPYLLTDGETGLKEASYGHTEDEKTLISNFTVFSYLFSCLLSVFPL